MNLTIDLIYSNGDPLNINDNLESLSNEFIENKTVYELNYLKIPEEVQKIEEKKEENKEEEKKDDKKKEEKKDKKNEEPPVPILEPLKFNGYCVRTIEEDSTYEENEPKNKVKKAAKKK